MLLNPDKNRLLLAVMICLVIIVSLSWWGYNSVGHRIVEDIYNGRSNSFFNGLMQSREIHSLDFYRDKADKLFLKMVCFLVYSCLSAIVIIFARDMKMKLKLMVFLFAAGIALNSQFLSYLSPYILNDDVRQHTWWMRQFQDKELFQGDLLAVYAKNIQPWGILAVYYPLSFVIDPVMAGKILPPILLGISAVYFYGIIFYVTKNESASISGAFIYSITPVFLRQMIGGHARAFAFPLMIIFLYYLIRKDHFKVLIFIVLQAIFYPMAAILSGLTYFFSFIEINTSGIHFDFCRKKLIFFIVAFILSGSVLAGKQFVSYDPEIGEPVSRNEVQDKIEFYNERWPLLPTPVISQELEKNLEKGIFLFRALRKKTVIKELHKHLQDKRVFLVVLLLSGVILVMIRKIILIPKEVYYLLVSGVLMYKLADMFFLKLYSPRRYLEYSAPLVSVLFVCFLVAALILSLRNVKVKRCFLVCLFAVVILNINVSRNEALIDMSENKELYKYLEVLPVDSLIAAHPDLADGIPIFSKRKVFIAKDISVPLFGEYWETVKKRTFDFLEAYYSDDASSIYDFCIKNDIDYLVVDKKHFNDKYILEGVYFEPFSSRVIELTEGRTQFVLRDIPDEYKIYDEGDIFVVEAEELKNL